MLDANAAISVATALPTMIAPIPRPRYGCNGPGSARAAAPTATTILANAVVPAAAMLAHAAEMFEKADAFPAFDGTTVSLGPPPRTCRICSRKPPASRVLLENCMGGRNWGQAKGPRTDTVLRPRSGHSCLSAVIGSSEAAFRAG